MRILRTPDDHFTHIDEWPHDPLYTEIKDKSGDILRVHHADFGPADAPTILLLHGEPSWGFLYRKVMSGLADAGIRSLVPDQIGFGRSDKPANKSDYTYERHVHWMQEWLDANAPEQLFFFGQDWGGLIGLRLVSADPDRFTGVILSNTGLPDGTQKPTDAFLAWQEFSKTAEEFPVGKLINAACLSDLTPEIISAYDAPFPDNSYKEGARVWPSLVPTSPDDPSAFANQEAWEVLRKFNNPFVCAFSDKDPVTRGGEKAFLSQVPGTQNQPHTTIENAHHFLQEDRPEELVRVIVDLISKSG
tara:strand:- start:175 stop:1083 length:909 start_codon:yes stop_codon:yes gene_type:complete